MVVTEIVSAVDRAAPAGRERDTLCLTWEERRWTRKRAVSSAGRLVALALPTGTVLRAGDVLVDEPGWYLVVEARPEAVLAAMPRDRAEAVRVAFEIGNRHFPLGLDGDALIVPDDVAMRVLLTRLDVAWECRHAVYEPIGGGGHRHDPGRGAPGGHRHNPGSGSHG